MKTKQKVLEKEQLKRKGKKKMENFEKASEEKRAKATLSKSLFVKGSTCPLAMWLSVYHPEEGKEMSLYEKNLVEQGNFVHKVYTDFFHASEIDRSKGLDKAVKATKKEIEKGTKYIAEAAFKTEDGLFCAVDLLEKSSLGFIIHEIKSTTKPAEEHIIDAEFQAAVLKSLGFPIIEANVIYINKDYIRGEELSIPELFLKLPVDLSSEHLSEIMEKAHFLRDLLKEKDIPETSMKSACTSCEFFGLCKKREQIPEHSVWDISGMQSKKKCELYLDGFVSSFDLAKGMEKPELASSKTESYLRKLNPKFALQIKTETGDLPPEIICEDEIKAHLMSYERAYPIYYLDFETIAKAIPPFQGMKPYEQRAVQYSLHILRKPGGELEHREFLAETGGDERLAIAKALVSDIGETGCIVAYNASFEKGCITSLAEEISDTEVSQRLLGMIPRFIDLMEPFQQKFYYHKDLHGKYSIKNVLPLFFPDDPSCDYHALPGAQNGTEAMNAFLEMTETKDKEKREEIRSGLLKYCCLDTLAMVKIHQKLVWKLTHFRG